MRLLVRLTVTVSPWLTTIAGPGKDGLPPAVSLKPHTVTVVAGSEREPGFAQRLQVTVAGVAPGAQAVEVIGPAAAADPGDKQRREEQRRPEDQGGEEGSLHRSFQSHGRSPTSHHGQLFGRGGSTRV